MTIPQLGAVIPRPRSQRLIGAGMLRFTAESIRRNIMAVGDTIRRIIASALLKKKSTNEAVGQITISIGVVRWRAARHGTCSSNAPTSARTKPNTAGAIAWPVNTPSPRVIMRPPRI